MPFCFPSSSSQIFQIASLGRWSRGEKVERQLQVTSVTFESKTMPKLQYSRLIYKCYSIFKKHFLSCSALSALPLSLLQFNYASISFHRLPQLPESSFVAVTTSLKQHLNFKQSCYRVITAGMLFIYKTGLSIQ